MSAFPIGATVGILGGGQLGRMLAFEGRRMGYRVQVLDPAGDGPAASVADGCVVGALDDVAAAVALARRADVVTLETEHVPAALLEEVARVAPLRPSAPVLATIQDRLTQKQFLARLGLPQARFAPAGSLAQLEAGLAQVGLPAILKTRRDGYDGKGQVRIERRGDAAAALAAIAGAPAVVETHVAFLREVSVVLARGLDGKTAFYPLAENTHRRHILHTSVMPAPQPAKVRRRAFAIAGAIAAALDHVGVMAVEMFLLADGALLVNEIAPRVHNSGHATYGAALTSQFEQHLRAILGLPLGDPALLRPAVIVNLLGDLWRQGPPPFARLVDAPNARLHLYGKTHAYPGRKMGHILVVDRLAEAALATAEMLHARLEAAAGLLPEREARPGARPPLAAG